MFDILPLRKHFRRCNRRGEPPEGWNGRLQLRQRRPALVGAWRRMGRVAVPALAGRGHAALPGSAGTAAVATFRRQSAASSGAGLL